VAAPSPTAPASCRSPPGSGTNQQFRFESAGTGWWRIIARHSGKVLDVWEWSTADNARISQYADLNGTNQHVYNNCYSNVGGYGVASTMNAGVLVEGNYFENTEDPFHRGEGDSGPGSLVARNNHFVNSGAGQAGGSVASIPYAYTLDSAANVKSIVTGTGGAGAGKITV
jgi:hypothetical protein